MAVETSEPRTPQRNAGLVSAWSRNQRLVPSPSRLPPRRVVLPASAPPGTPKTTDRIRRLTFDPTIPNSQKPPVFPSLPSNIPTEPAAMRRAQQNQQAMPPPTPRRRVVPNVLPEDEPEMLSQSHTKPEYTKYIPPFQPCLPFTRRGDNTIAEKQVKTDCCSDSRYTGIYYDGYNAPSVPKFGKIGYYSPQDVPTNTRNGLINFPDTRAKIQTDLVPTKDVPSTTDNDPFTSQGARKSVNTAIGSVKENPAPINKDPFKSQKGRTIAGTELINYTAAQQAADYKSLMADSEPEETWESRRGAPMVPEASSWSESDTFAGQWYNAIILSYRQDSENGERLGGTDEEKEREMQAKQAGHLTGVSVELEVERHNFEADLLRRAKDMILRDNGIMPRGGIGEPAVDEESQAWSDGMGLTRK